LTVIFIRCNLIASHVAIFVIAEMYLTFSTENAGIFMVYRHTEHIPTISLFVAVNQKATLMLRIATMFLYSHKKKRHVSKTTPKFRNLY